jgi:hypothetical protein
MTEHVYRVLGQEKCHCNARGCCCPHYVNYSGEVCPKCIDNEHTYELERATSFENVPIGEDE